LHIGDIENAIKTFKHYVSLYPEEALPYRCQGDAYYQAGDLEQAIMHFRKALSIKPDFASGRKLAYIYALSQEYSEAIRCINNYIDLTQRPNGYVYSAIYHALQGNSQQFLDDLKQRSLINEDPDPNISNLENWLEGWFYYDRGDTERSKKAFIKAFKMIDSITDSTLRVTAVIDYNIAMGMLDMRQGQVDAAQSKLISMKEHLHKLDDSEWDDGQYYLYQLFSIEILLAESRLDSALVACNKLSPFTEDTSLWYFYIPFTKDIKARVHLQKGEIDNAIVEYEKLITFDPKIWDFHLIHPKYHYRLAKLYEQTEQLNKAINEYERFLGLWKNADKDHTELIDAKQRLAVLHDRN
jgi:tetratricopeptide (TPR) repeat protein